MSDNPLLNTFLSGVMLELDAPLGFSCRGCGNLCCVDNDVFLTPPEAARIIWFLRRNPELEAHLQAANIPWGVVFIGETTGLPNVKLNHLRRPGLGNACVFLSPITIERNGAIEPSGMFGCGVHSARPGACRFFPVGRIENSAYPGQARYAVIANCPGFSAAPPEQVTPPGYRPPDPAQTIRDWVQAQSDPEQEAERRFYVNIVVPALLQAGLHAPTDDYPDGRLSDEQALDLGYQVLFQPPDPPANPADDHRMIIEWLQRISAAEMA